MLATARFACCTCIWIVHLLIAHRAHEPVLKQRPLHVPAIVIGKSKTVQTVQEYIILAANHTVQTYGLSAYLDAVDKLHWNATIEIVPW